MNPNSKSNLKIADVIELIKPITWFPPMWAYACGAVSGANFSYENIFFLLLGLILSGPLVCGMSQAANDWCDREVDSINEPNRPIPSGRVSPQAALWIAILMSVFGIFMSYFLGVWGLVATVVAVTCAWAYSLEPIRLKRSGIWGPGVVALCYEGLPWFTGAAVLSNQFPDIKIVAVALLYAFGAHGIMTLNDFKALEGDKKTGINSLPVTLGPKRAAQIACAIMLIPQLVVISLLFQWDKSFFAILIAFSLFFQLVAMRVLLKNPKEQTPWYNKTGVLLYIIGMMVTAIALRTI